jgi:hypothetical protein
MDITSPMRLSYMLLPFLFLAPPRSSFPTSDGTLEQRFPVPEGVRRTPAQAGSFAHYLRNLQLRSEGTPVLLFDGSPKARQDVHAAVVDLSVGRKDLQQCADAVIRLRAEYLYANGRQDEIAFDLTNGFRVHWERWRSGERVKVQGNTCSWTGGGAVASSHAQLLRYLEFVFMYAGTLGLSKELIPAGTTALRAGDVLIQGGSPGHAVLVLDVAVDSDGVQWCMLGQSYMPAQDFHVLKNPAGDVIGPWYRMVPGATLRTPEWTFSWNDRSRWAE